MNAIKINPCDNVAVVLEAVKKGTEIFGVTAVRDIPPGHKIALREIKEGEQVIKYGFPIGSASKDIRAGDHVHTQNIKTGLSGVIEYTYKPTAIPPLPSKKGKTFMGYRREDGKAGVRNEIWIIPTVGCVNGIVQTLEKQAAPLIKGSIEGIAAFPHPYGCSQLGEDQENTRKILANLVCHPNAGAVLVVGLGCENSGIDVLKKYMGEYDGNRVKFLKCQDTEDEIQEGMKLLSELAEYAAGAQRTEIPVSELIIGLKCGGSDGFSGITANPLVGRFSDMLVSEGGTTVLTEVPEMFGAETILMNRAESPGIFDKTVSMINNFKNYYEASGQPIYENPSPGNKEGGISTLEDKSLGCTQKSGTSAVKGVLEYGECVTEKGLNLLSAPGNDLVAATALAAAGAQIVLFTTGRGTPFASPVPTVKISSNSPLASKKSGWIDFNAGTAAENGDFDDLQEALFEKVLKIASGEKVKSEIAGFHDMAIFKKGVTL